MTVRKNSSRGYWEIDIRMTRPDTGEEVRIRRKAERQTQKGARREQRRIKNAIEDGTFFDEEGGEDVPTYTEMAYRWIEHSRLAASTMHGYESRIRNHAIPQFGHKKVDEITTIDLEELEDRLERRELSHKTLKNTIAATRKVLNHAKKHEIIDEVPDYTVPDPQRWGQALVDSGEEKKRGQERPGYLTEGQASRLIEHAHPRVRLPIKIALYAGLRHSEIMALRWTNVDLEESEIKVRWAWTSGELHRGKSDKATREVPILPQLQEALEQYREEWESEGEWRGAKDWLFQRSDEPYCPQPWGQTYTNKPIRESYRNAGLDDEVGTMGFHILRHTFCTNLVDRGVPLVHVQQLAGHADHSTTLRYVHRNQNELRDSIEEMSGFAA